MTTKKILMLLLALVMIFSLVACGPGKDDPQKTDPSAPAATGDSTEPDSAQTEAPKAKDNILKIGGSGYDGVFNPIMSSNVYDAYVCDLIFEALVQLDKEGNYIPMLATWEVSEDKKTYTFTLKDGIKFSDGTPLTAEDVAFTYRTIADPKYDGPRAYAVDGMVGYDEYHKGTSAEFAGIEVKDEKTIAFTFKEAVVSNIENFGYGILSKEYYAFGDNFDTFKELIGKPMGSGPMLLEDFAPKQHILLETNKEYWDTARVPKIDGVLISEVTEETILAALESGQIDHAQPQTNKDNLDKINEMPNVTAVPFLGNGYTFMCFETTTPPFDQKEVRQAMLYALNRKEFIKAEYKSEELASVGMAPLSPTSWAFPDEGLNPYDFDLNKANELLDKAGWEMKEDGFRYKDGEKLTVRWLVYTESTWTQTLSGLAADTWKQIGVDLIIDLMDFNTVAEKTMDADPAERPKNFDVYTMGFSLSVDPDLKGALFDADAGEKGGFNASGFRDEHVQELIAKGRTTFDQAERVKIYAELAKILNDEVATAIVAYRYELWAVNNRVKNLDVSTYLKWTAFIHDIELTD
ncbi:MAG TPA: ABC transporter substrate-binding protein [Bacillota bacterium]|nr:ABC transporter substrate-binding protein [Bacillota bacterium]